MHVQRICYSRPIDEGKGCYVCVVDRQRCRDDTPPPDEEKSKGKGKGKGKAKAIADAPKAAKKAASKSAMKVEAKAAPKPRVATRIASPAASEVGRSSKRKRLETVEGVAGPSRSLRSGMLHCGFLSLSLPTSFANPMLLLRCSFFHSDRPPSSFAAIQFADHDFAFYVFARFLGLA